MTSMGFGKKLYLSSIGIILLTILIIAGVTFYQAKANFLAKGKAGIQNVSNVLLKTVKVQHNFHKAKLTSDLTLLKKSDGKNDVQVTTVTTMLADINAFDIKTRDTLQLSLPKLAFGANIVTGDYRVVDQVGQFSDSEIAVFQLFNDKLIKVSTTSADKEGKRGVGAYYTQETQPYTSVMAEKRHLFLSGTGRQKQIQLMESFRDVLEDEIAGAFSVSRSILTQDLDELVTSVTVSGQGYAFINDSQGNILVHPDKTVTGKKVQSFQDGDQILKTKNGFVSFQTADRLYYAYTMYFEPWDLYFTVAVSNAELMAGINRQIFNSVGLSGLIALITGILIMGLINRQLMRSMTGMATMAKQVANGTFNHRFQYNADDAIRDTVDAMDDMVKELAQMIGQMNSGVKTLRSDSDALNTISDQMSRGADATVSQINTVASAAEEMSVNMTSVAAAMEQASTNVGTVAEGTSKMRSSIETVSKNSRHTQEITNRAVEQSKLASERVQRLGNAADEINKVTETINNISSQTNLLALNATIEAARAGEAGKGFSVVAMEIKELASQTAGATGDIELNIKEIQDQISGAVNEIQDISKIIYEINTFVTEASSAIEVQSEATTDIIDNISQVSTGIQEVNENVSQSSSVSSQVAHEIASVLEASKQIIQFSSDVKQKAESLNAVMIQLNTATKKFQV